MINQRYLLQRANCMQVQMKKREKRGVQSEAALIRELRAQEAHLKEELRQLNAALLIYRELERRAREEANRDRGGVSLRSCA